MEYWDKLKSDKNAFFDKEINVHGGNQSRPNVHVDDVAEGHLLAFEKGIRGARYVLGGDNMGLAEILTIISEKTGRRPPAIRIPHQAVMPIAYIAEGWARLFGGREPFVAD